MVYDNLFHIHTKRCSHAGNESDEEYIETAIKLKAKSIYFTDHAPFPKNSFGNRMKIEELSEYISSMNELKRKYNNIISINYGLEIEYLHEYIDYYIWLKEKYAIPLYLGQHICTVNGAYNFEYEKKTEEYKWLTASIIEALSTNLFSGVFHPERVFKNIETWKEEHTNSAIMLWNSFNSHSIPVEYNYSSNPIHRKLFWEHKNSNNIIYGIDAHSTKELIDGTEFFRNMEPLEG